VEHGKNSEQRILGTDFYDSENGICLADEVGVGEHDAFWIGGGARGVKQCREVALGGHDWLKIGRAGGEDGVEIGEQMLGTVEPTHGRRRRRRDEWGTRTVGILFCRRRRHHQTYVESICVESIHCFRRHRKMLYIAEQQGSPAVDQQLLHLIGLESGVERDRRSSGGDDS